MPSASYPLLAVSSGINRALVECKIILIRKEHIIDTRRNDELILHEFSVDACVQCAKRRQLIELLLTF